MDVLEKVLDFAEPSIALCALLLSIYTFVITSKSNAKQRHTELLFELYQLGKTYVSNMYSYDHEINKLNDLIETQISGEEFNKIYHSAEYEQLRESISYFGFLQKMIEDKSLSSQECYKVVTFPQNLFSNLGLLISFERENHLHDFDRFDKFCKNYIEYMKRETKHHSGNFLSVK